ncbi:hypothetical protein SADFL11_00050970 (plasmid) [Roseibium alexandrii DFL-11]|uniref:Uncharacterized protein n=1 Tax=Roseibium alexandrii (strain DSM 17067 / NCIMB 14079 / DFL-11) TaxID=244592 RepID=A0A5E8UX49_ROSAD|nr:hypothetical protein SADFL11_00050970 [Roseibium alexandrii DFL-11]
MRAPLFYAVTAFIPEWITVLLIPVLSVKVKASSVSVSTSETRAP